MKMYEHEIVRYFDHGKNSFSGRIEFADFYLAEEADTEITTLTAKLEALQARVEILEYALNAACRDMSHPHLGDTTPAQWVKIAERDALEAK